METTALWEFHMELVHAIGNVWDIWLAPFPTGVALGSFVSILTLCTMIAGSAATIAFVFYRFRQSTD